MAHVKLYEIELLNRPGVVWSPNTSKTRYALNLKKIPYEVEWLNFETVRTVIPEITKSKKRPLVPVIEHKKNNDKVVEDSWDIALYLEEQYPNNPSLFNGQIGIHKFFQIYCEHNVMAPLFKLIIKDICKLTGPAELQQWFRQDREARFKMTLEEFSGDEKKNIKALKQGLLPINRLLKTYPYITGDKPGWADVVLASTVVFMQGVRPDLFERSVLNAFGADDKTIRNWWDRMEEIRTGVATPRL